MEKNHEKTSRWEILKANWMKFKPLFLSHHPDCEKYAHHVFRLGNTRLCAGCFIGYPVAFITLFVCYFILYPNVSSRFHIGWLIFGGIMLATQLLSFTELTENRLVKFVQKAFVGFGGAVIISYILFQITNLNWFWFLLNLWGLGMLFISPIALMRYKAMIKQCETCEWYENNDKCPLEKYRRN